MLSKEEIKRDLVSLSCTHKQFGTIIDNTLEYINQLESDKQNLIEKLEKIKYDLEYDRRMNNYSYLSDIQEILSILKGEKEC